MISRKSEHGLVTFLEKKPFENCEWEKGNWKEKSRSISKRNVEWHHWWSGCMWNKDAMKTDGAGKNLFVKEVWNLPKCRIPKEKVINQRNISNPRYCSAAKIWLYAKRTAYHSTLFLCINCHCHFAHRTESFPKLQFILIFSVLSFYYSITR